LAHNALERHCSLRQVSFAFAERNA
jgi:hypothetical protein